MKASEKELIFDLLKAASDSFYGYSSPAFAEKPVFTDDAEPSASEIEESNSPAAVQENSPASIQEQPVSSVQPVKTVTQEEEAQDSSAHKVTETAQISKPAHSSGNPGSETSSGTASSAEMSAALETIHQKILTCKRCGLHSTRNNVVPGTGIPGAPVLVIGEGPGEEEDKQGLPFVGPAGKLLDKMLAAIQLDRNVNCYIANIVKCRPPYNRDPQKEEADACKSFLDAQIHILKPKMILALGKVALRNLLSIEGEFSLNRYRGKIFEYQGIPVISTYHPSALLRNIEFKKPAWEDLKFFKTELEKISPDYADGFKGAE